MAEGLLRQALARCRRAFGFAALFSSISNLLMLTASIYMLQLYDRVLSTRSTDTLMFLTLIALAALLTLGLIEIARSRLLLQISTFLDSTLAPVAFEGSIRNSLQGRSYRSEALRDLGEIRQFLTGPGIIAFFDLPWAPFFLIVIFVLSPALGMFSALSMLLLFLLAYVNDRRSRTRLDRAREASSEAMRMVETCTRNAELIDALGMVKAVAQRWFQINLEALQHQAAASSSAATIIGLSKFFRLSVQILVLAVGAWLVIHQQLTGGGMIAASIILGRALAPIDYAIGVGRHFISARAAYRRLDECFDEPPLRPAGMRLPAPRGELRADQVGYLASNGRALVSDVSFHLAPGETLAIVGPSGAGKTTLGKLIVGIAKPSAGHVRLDGADIFPWNRDDLGRHIGYLPQDVALFGGSIAENIARLRDVDSTEIIEAAQKANVHELILRLPNGYDTEINPWGGGLSGGQRQRIGLARALFGRPSLVVLDEPNSNLDSEGDTGLVRALSELRAQGTTIVFISHRPGLIAYADKLLLLRDGVSEMFGPRQQIMERLKPHSIAARGARWAAASEPVLLREAGR